MIKKLFLAIIVLIGCIGLLLLLIGGYNIVTDSVRIKNAKEDRQRICNEAKASMKFEDFEKKLKILGITDGYIKTNLGKNKLRYSYVKPIMTSEGTGFVCRVIVENGLIVEAKVD